MNGKQAKKIRKEISKLERQLDKKHMESMAGQFKVFVNTLKFKDRLKIAYRILRKKF